MKDHCGAMMAIVVETSEIKNIWGDSNRRSVLVVSGNIYQLVGNPAPSFMVACRSMGINPNSKDALHRLYLSLNKITLKKYEFTLKGEGVDSLAAWRKAQKAVTDNPNYMPYWHMVKD